jgi:hypothetical protein
MRDGPVYNDYQTFKEFDASNQATKHITKSLIVSLAIMIPLMASIYYYAETAFQVILLEILLGTIFMGLIIFYYNGRNTTKMNMAHHGYNVNWNLQRQRFFGWETYHILRADPGTLQAAIIGFNNNPFSVSKQQIQRIESKQRENATCEICQQELFEQQALERDGAYFIEKRKRLWLFGLPIKEKIINWDSYCPQHKPPKHEYTN